MQKNFSSIKIGLLGGGQLGRMLLQKAADFSLNLKVLDPDPSAPCRYLTEEFVNGSFKDYDAVYAFGQTCDLITIEIEDVNTEALEKLEGEGKQIFPQPRVIRLVQDKGLQKLFFREHGIPTAGFEILSGKSDLLSGKVNFPFMQKLRRGGYDGKGVRRISGDSDLHDAFDAPSLAEQIVSFKKEISVIVARNTEGKCSCFPSVEMEFNTEANLVEFLFSPSEISEETEKLARKIAIDVANAIEIVGLLAVEMFVTHDNEILVNEIAPRPHNSGHQTIEGNVTSQYEQHLRTILGLPFGNTQILRPAVMVNLLGEKNHDGVARYKNMREVLSMDGVYVHLYGKKFTRPFRKMGHVTITADSIDEAKEKAYKVKRLLKVESE